MEDNFKRDNRRTKPLIDFLVKTRSSKLLKRNLTPDDSSRLTAEIIHTNPAFMHPDSRRYFAEWLDASHADTLALLDSEGFVRFPQTPRPTTVTANWTEGEALEFQQHSFQFTSVSHGEANSEDRFQRESIEYSGHPRKNRNRSSGWILRDLFVSKISSNLNDSRSRHRVRQG